MDIHTGKCCTCIHTKKEKFFISSKTVESFNMHLKENHRSILNTGFGLPIGLGMACNANLRTLDKTRFAGRKHNLQHPHQFSTFSFLADSNPLNTCQDIFRKIPANDLCCPSISISPAAASRHLPQPQVEY